MSYFNDLSLASLPTAADLELDRRDYGRFATPRTAAAADQARAWTPQTTHHTFLSVDYTITETQGRRPEYRVRVDGTFYATESTEQAAHDCARDIIEVMCEQGMVGAL